MAVEAILFDLDDTLVVDEACADAAILATCERARERYGIDQPALGQSVRHNARQLWRASPTITYCQSIGMSSWEGLWARFLGSDPNLKALRTWAPTYRQEAWSRALADHGVHDAAFAEQLAAAFQDERRSRHTVYPDAEPALKGLQETHQLALVTNGVPDLQREKIQAADLAQYFSAIVMSGDVGVGKPDPRVFALALDKLGIGPDMALMVGNSLHRDIIGAQQAGIRDIWLNRSGADRHEDCTPYAEIASLSEVRDVLQHRART